MWMMEQVLAPGVQYAEKADSGPQVFRIGGNLQESFSTGSKQQIIEQFFVMEYQRSQYVWNCEDQMYIGHGQEFPLASGYPLFSGIVQTLGTMPVPAAVVRDGHGMAASTTAVPVASECCRSATLDGRENLAV